MTANRSRAKGDRFERSCVEQLGALGIEAQRIPLSGAAGGMFSGDIMARVRGSLEKIECKCRARAWKDLYGWLPGNYCLLIKQDRSDTLVVMSLETFAKLSKGA